MSLAFEFSSFRDTRIASVFEDEEEQSETNKSIKNKSIDQNNNMISSALTDVVKANKNKTGDDIKQKKKKKKKRKKEPSSDKCDTLIYPATSPEPLPQGSHSTQSTRMSSLPDDGNDESSNLWPRDQEEQWENTTKSSDLASMGGLTDVDINSTWARGAGQSVTGESIENPRRVFTKIDRQKKQRRSSRLMNQQSSILISSPDVAADPLLTKEALPVLASNEETRMSGAASLAGETEFSNVWKESDVARSGRAKENEALYKRPSKGGTIHEMDEAGEVSMMAYIPPSQEDFHGPKIKSFRFCLIFGILILVASITATTIVLLGKRGASSGSANSPESTVTPSASPVKTYEQLSNWAINVSGYDALHQPDSPQVDAILWMTGFDRVSFESLDLPFLQRYALVVFFLSTGGYTWTDWKRWLDPNLHECDWSEGFTCMTDELQRRIVIGINETSNGLSGSLPVELKLLDDLVYLHLAHNKIYGSIPDIVGQLTRLTSLDLSSNKLHGPIPPSIKGAEALVELRLSNNNINGSIPSTLYELSMLQTLDLSWNEIMGPVVDEVSGLQKLVTFNVRHNHLSGSIPFPLYDVTTLDNLWLDYNKFSGSIPEFTIAMANPLQVTMSHNQLTGTLPFSNSGYRRVQQVGNNILMRQEYMDLSYNRFTGTIDILLGMMPALRYLDFSGNGFSGQFPGDVGWTSIEHLVLANNDFSGTIPTGWGQYLSHLDFGNNSITGEIPSGLCKFSSLNFLKLDHNIELNGSIPSCLFDLSSLQAIDLSATSLVGTVPTSIGQLFQLESLDISDNLLNGTIPSEIGMCTQLTALDVSSNQLTGVIPSDFGRLEFLRSILVKNNNLTGSVPEELGMLSKLESLSLSGNNLQGSIPEELCAIRGQLLDVGCRVECSCCDNRTRYQC